MGWTAVLPPSQRVSLRSGQQGKGAPCHAEVYHRRRHHWYRSREEYAAPRWPRCMRSGRVAREGGPHQNCVAARECGAMLDRDTGTHYVTRGLLALGHDVRQVPPVHAKPFRQTHKMTFEMRMRLLKPCNAPRLGAYHRRRTNSLIYRRCIACATAWWRNEPRSSIRSAAFSWSTDAKGT